MRKMKVVCHQENGAFQEHLYVDGERLDCAFDTETEHAEIFLHAFAPKMLTQQCAERYGEDFVLVFRTDDTQMQEFAALLAEYDGTA